MSERLTKVGNYWTRRPQAHPIHDPWTVHARDAAEAVIGAGILTVLLFGVPFIVWLVLS